LATLSAFPIDIAETLGVAATWETIPDALGHATLRVNAHEYAPVGTREPALSSPLEDVCWNLEPRFQYRR
jgi:hypothetical protein